MLLSEPIKIISYVSKLNGTRFMNSECIGSINLYSYKQTVYILH